MPSGALGLDVDVLTFRAVRRVALRDWTLISGKQPALSVIKEAAQRVQDSFLDSSFFPWFGSSLLVVLFSCGEVKFSSVRLNSVQWSAVKWSEGGEGLVRGNFVEFIIHSLPSNYLHLRPIPSVGKSLVGTKAGVTWVREEQAFLAVR